MAPFAGLVAGSQPPHPLQTAPPRFSAIGRRYPVDVKTVVIGPPPPELQQLVQRRRSLGLDRFDEVWEGNLHLVPVPGLGHAYIEREVARVLRPFADATGLIETGPFNLGRASDFRVPDGGYHRSMPQADALYVATAALVVEVLSQDDETHEKLPFYAAHGVEEVIVVEPVFVDRQDPRICRRLRGPCGQRGSRAERRRAAKCYPLALARPCPGLRSSEPVYGAAARPAARPARLRLRRPRPSQQDRR